MCTPQLMQAAGKAMTNAAPVQAKPMSPATPTISATPQTTSRAPAASSSLGSTGNSAINEQLPRRVTLGV